jgi:biotin carboxylase
MILEASQAGSRERANFQQEIMRHKDFRAGNYNTGFVEKLLAERGSRQ